MLTINGKEFENDVVIAWIKDAVCEHFHISRGTLGENTRVHISSYPRKLFWYISRVLYGIKLKEIQEIDGHDFGHSAVIIQSENVKLGKAYDKVMRYDVESILEKLKEKIK